MPLFVARKVTSPVRLTLFSHFLPAFSSLWGALEVQKDLPECPKGQVLGEIMVLVEHLVLPMAVS